jgi:hypothetical protein
LLLLFQEILHPWLVGRQRIIKQAEGAYANKARDLLWRVLDEVKLRLRMNLRYI